MALCLDTEFNSFRGELISLALVDVDTSDYWYGAMTPTQPIHPWVAEHVMPLIDREPLSPEAFTNSLRIFLLRYPGTTIVADWPEDFVHLCNQLCDEGGRQLRWEGDLRLVRSPDLHPATPHNALSDAVALANWWRTVAKESPTP